MKHNIEIMEWKPAELEGAERFFRRLTGTAPDDPRFSDNILAARQLVIDKTVAKAVIRRISIESRDEESVTLEGGNRLNGSMPVRALGDAKELYAFVLSLTGFENVRSNDMLTDYYTDTWGSAITERAQNALADMIGSRAQNEGMKRTHVWSPGQHTFDLSNQRTLFDVLKPEMIGCWLTESLMMVPVKSSSGIIGLVPEDTEFMPRPCDYCQFRKKCHPDENGCPSL